MSEPTKIEYRYMFDRHRTFNKEMKQISNDQVINVGKRIGDSKMTVRDVVNNIRDISDNKRILHLLTQNGMIQQSTLQFSGQTNLPKLEASLKTYQPTSNTYILKHP